MTNGDVVAPRGMETREFVPAIFEIKNPLSRIISLKSRKMNLFYAMIETLWYLNGDDAVEPLDFYNKQMKRFSDDGVTLRGAYGARLINRNSTLDKSQFGLIYDKLKADAFSRQAVAIIWQPWHDHAPVYPDGKVSKDIPCTIGFAFTIRDNKLNMTTFMRSNDIVLGTTYDVFAFTIFHEFLARKLGVGLGAYTHVANSFHIYDMHYDMAKEMIKDNTPVYIMPEMPDTNWGTLNKLYALEHKFRKDEIDFATFQEEVKQFDRYWAQWMWALRLHKAVKDQDPSSGQTCWARLDQPYQELLTHWMEKLI